MLDGHGGDEIADTCKYNLTDHVQNHSSETTKETKTWLTQAFLDFDNSTKHFINEGCSVIAAYIDHDKQMLYIANAGNARCIIGKNGKVVSSVDHVPHDP